MNCVIKKILKAALKTLLVLCCAALLLEAALRAAGWAARQRDAEASGAAKTVLCAGDSFVWGVGGKSFPAQLQEILDEKKPGVYSVLNAGTAGTNSAQMLSKLPEQLTLYKPNFVILLTGSSNYWNSIGLRPGAWLARTALYRFFSMALRGRSESGGLSVLPSCGCVLQEIPDGLPSPGAVAPPAYVPGGAALPALYADTARLLSSGGNCGAAAKLARELARSQPGNVSAQSAASRVLASCGNGPAACELAGRASALAPNSSEAKSAAADCLLASGEHARAAEAYDGILRSAPDPWLYSQLAQAYFENGDRGKALRACEKGLRLFPEYRELLKLSLKTLVFSGRYAKAWDFLLARCNNADFNVLLETFYGALMDIGEYRLAEKYADKLSVIAGEKRQYAYIAVRLSAARQAQRALDAGGGAGKACGPSCLAAMGDAALQICEYAAALDFYRRAGEEGLPRWQVLAKLAALEGCRGNCRLGGEYSREAVALSKGDVLAHIAAARLEHSCRSHAQAWKAYARALPLAPGSKLLLREASEAAVLAGKGKEFKVLTKAEPDFLPARHEEGKLLWWLDDGPAQRRLEKDLSAACALARGAGAKVILSSYPEWHMHGAAAAAAAQGVPYIDFTALFGKRFKRRAEYVSADNSHCNSAGYRVMAEAYAEKVLELDQ